MNSEESDNQYTILLAEDDVLIQKVTMHYLQNSPLNVNVRIAENGKIACELANELKPNLILMDWFMPEMSGIEAVKVLKKNKATAEIPIIILTASTGSEKLETAFEAGAIDFIRKPYDKTEFLARIKSVLRIVESKKHIEQQNAIIKENNQKISQSISYTANLQESMRIPPERLQKLFPESFIFFKSKDVLSGDFYWFKKIGKRKFVASVDCTGHGIPGAFLSTMGHIYLNQIVNSEEKKPADILIALHKAIRNILRQDETENLDGMSIGLCAINSETNELLFSGADQDIQIIKNHQSKIYEGNIFEIGGLDVPSDYNFENTKILLEPNDMIYMYSDGFQDQTGGNEQKKFSKKRLTHSLIQISGLPPKQQKEELKKKLKSWQGSENQVDDVLVMGIKHQ